MDTEVNKNPEKEIEDIRLLKKELRENRFQKQSLEKHIEEGRRLIGDTILRMRSIKKNCKGLGGKMKGKSSIRLFKRWVMEWWSVQPIGR